MSPVEQLTQITSILQDVSIKNTITDDPKPMLPVADGKHPISEYDSKVYQLLDMIDEYEKLTNNDYRLSFINGYLNLSRANYGNNTRKYGSCSYDLRPYKSCKQIKLDNDQFIIQDLLKKENQTLNQEKESMKGKEKANVNKDDDHGDSIGVTTSSTKFTNLIGNRSTDIIEEDLTDLELPLKDPVQQFGSLVPYQLRQSKVYFESSLSNIIKVLNCQNKIAKLINEIENDKSIKVNAKIEDEELSKNKKDEASLTETKTIDTSKS